MISEETQTLITIMAHIAFVQRSLDALIRKLQDRSSCHDASKFWKDEFQGFIQINKTAREHKYGSPEYQASLKAVEPNPVELHYSRNRHHPEHHENGIDDMGLVDLIEMVADWKAASLTYGNTSFDESLEISIKRFDLRPEQIYLVKLIAKELE